jgi:hypothetical protein
VGVTDVAKVRNSGAPRGGALRRGLSVAYYQFWWPLKHWFRDTINLGTAMAFLLGGLGVFAGVFNKAVEFGLIESKELASQVNTALFIIFIVSSIVIWRTRVYFEKQSDIIRELFSKLWLLLRPWDRSVARDAATQFVLRDVVFASFKSLGAQRVWFWRADGAGGLIVDDASVYPLTSDRTYVRRLASGEGVAGAAFADLKSRYVPRLFLPFSGEKSRRMSFKMTTAIVFGLRDGDDISKLDIERERLDESAVSLSKASVPSALVSFIAVPAIPLGDEPCQGVLCIDFTKPDPVGRRELKMIAVFGALLAERTLETKSAAPAVAVPSP